MYKDKQFMKLAIFFLLAITVYVVSSIAVKEISKEQDHI